MVLVEKETRPEPKGIQMVLNTDGTQSMFVFIILEKIKETRLKFSQGSATVLQKMT